MLRKFQYTMTSIPDFFEEKPASGDWFPKHPLQTTIQHSKNLADEGRVNKSRAAVKYFERPEKSGRY